MSLPVLTLGSVVFQDMEIPEKIEFGGRQKIAAQSLIGGGKVVDALGYEEGIIRFSGICSGSDAVSRVSLLDIACAQGTTLPLSWDQFFYVVVIKEFFAEYRKSSLIPFSISCVVVSNQNLYLENQTASVAAMVASDWLAASGYSGQAGISMASFESTNGASYNEIQSQIASGMTETGAFLVGGLGSFNASQSPVSAATDLTKIVEASGQLAAQSIMSGYINRAATNFANEQL